MFPGEGDGDGDGDGDSALNPPVLPPLLLLLLLLLFLLLLLLLLAPPAPPPSSRHRAVYLASPTGRGRGWLAGWLACSSSFQLAECFPRPGQDGPVNIEDAFFP